VEEVDGDKHAEDDETRDHYQQPITEKKTEKKEKNSETRTPKTTRSAITISSQ